MSAFFGEDSVGPSQNDLPSHSPNSSEAPSDEPPQRRKEPWTRKEKIAAAAVAATLLAAVPTTFALVAGSAPGTAPGAEKSNGLTEASGKPQVEPPETPSGAVPSKPLTESASFLIRVTDPRDGKELCVDADTNKGRSGDAIQLWGCLGETKGQRWELHPDKTLRVWGKCLDIVENSSKEHAKLHLWRCNGVGGQQWEYTEGKQLKNPQSELCLNVPKEEMYEGARLEIYGCSGNSWTQEWDFVRPADY